MSEQHGSKAQEPQSEVSAEPREVDAAAAGGIARRRLLKAALLATPMLVTLQGRAVVGSDGDFSSLGSLGIFYGLYDDEGNPLGADGLPLGDPDNPHTDRREAFQQDGITGQTND